MCEILFSEGQKEVYFSEKYLAAGEDNRVANSW